MIRDTAAQDRRIDTAPSRPLWHWLLGAGLPFAVAVLLFAGVGGWLSGERSRRKSTGLQMRLRGSDFRGF